VSWLGSSGASVGRANEMNRPFTVYINQRLIKGPYGGGNQWLQQLLKALSFNEISVTHKLRSPSNVILLSDYRLSRDDLAYLKLISTPIIHRINECDARKLTTGVDEQLATVNALATHTIFLSKWLRDYHTQRWFNPQHPHTIIPNGADSSIFYPDLSKGINGSDSYLKIPEPTPFRFVTHHWSDNWHKGFGTYAYLDWLLSRKTFPTSHIEFWVIGRWPRTINWQAARTFKPCSGPTLARLLRSCTVYLTASQSEPGGMHVAEALNCGLPILYQQGGGAIAEQVGGAGMVFGDDFHTMISTFRGQYMMMWPRVSSYAVSGDTMCRAYLNLLTGYRASASPS